MARAPLLQLSDISLTFGGNPVFDGLNLTVQPGDRVALVGRNGSGKSTLMKVMAGLVEPDAARSSPPPASMSATWSRTPTCRALPRLAISPRGLPDGEDYRLSKWPPRG
jgi:ATP-binding cassette subfamily F protein uup